MTTTTIEIIKSSESGKVEYMEIEREEKLARLWNTGVEALEKFRDTVRDDPWIGLDASALDDALFWKASLDVMYVAADRWVNGKLDHDEALAFARNQATERLLKGYRETYGRYTTTAINSAALTAYRNVVRLCAPTPYLHNPNTTTR